ncbi:uncharacterized protein LOC113350360 [Papaver somniferum]|uniref:uncharacterized protein LOC113350360 n=1 Tax=Papaver somniferum TaxID=3469 RepID=UPI000E6FEB7E|nr:uncharacterized protein LOC113350360 [Papaver somniferum]
MQGIPEENIFTRLARIQNEGSGNAGLYEKSGDSDPLGDDENDDAGSVVDARSVSQNGNVSERFVELVDEAVTEINLQIEANIRRNAGETTFAIVETTPPKEFPEQVPSDEAVMVTSSEIPLVTGEALVMQPVVPGAIFDPPFDTPYAGHVLEALQRMKAALAQKDELLLKDFP